MGWFKNLKVTAKLMIGFTVVLLLSGTAGAIGAGNIANTPMLIVSAACVVLAITLGAYISQVTGRGIAEMAEAASLLALGDVEINANGDFGNDEVGELAGALKKIAENIREQALIIEKISGGDLTADVEIKSENDLLGKKMHEMIEKTNELLKRIAGAAEQLAIGARQISDSSASLSQGATKQASATEELTASLEEISSQTNMNAQSASKANELAVVAKDSAVVGNNQMNRMMAAMEEINEASENISRIIKVIDEIAFQTNLLSLNAAVEAARAGEQGKGFAVVAEEVRELAARSAKAAKETAELIEDSIQKVNDGTKIAQKTADALRQIVEGISKAASYAGDIAVASSEQASGITQINQGIVEVSEVVRTNSATSEEAAAASEELLSQTELLRESVRKFRLKNEGQNSEISPELLKMLEDMNEKSNSGFDIKDDIFDYEQKKSISDKEFAKY